MVKFLQRIPALITALAAAAWGTSFNIGTTTVDDWNDDGKCSLAEAMHAINWMVPVNTNDCPAGTGADTIKLQGGTFSAPVNYISSHTLTFYNHVVIIGKGIDRTLITANFTDVSLSRLIDFQDQRTGTFSIIRGVTLQRQGAVSICGIFSAPGTKTWLIQSKVRKFDRSGVIGQGAEIRIDSSSIQDNSSLGIGGGVCVFYSNSDRPGSLTMTSSSVTGNSGSIGGGIYYAGEGLSNLYSVTIANNIASSGKGGGVYMESPLVGYLELYGCTISGNSASLSGGGVAENSASTPPRLTNSLVAGNSAPGYKDVDGRYWNTNTMFGDYAGNTAPLGQGSQVNAAPGIGSLKETGWPLNIKMIPLTSASAPAVDGTDPNQWIMTGKDGRGMDRLVDGNEDGNKTNDFGAFEYNPLLKETDALGLGPKSAEPYHVYTDQECSGNVCTSFEGSSSSAYLTYYLRVNRPGIYNLKIRFKKNNNRGIVQPSYGPLGGGMIGIGAPRDLYAATPSFSEMNFGNLSFGTAGVKVFKFQLTGKNPASSNYFLYFDYLKLTGP